jgi:hypothetical protein
MPSENAVNPRGEVLAERIANTLRQAIDEGDYPPGALLPGEKTLADTLGASVPSIRLGLAILGAEGRIETVNGRGTLVRPAPLPAHLIEFDPANPLHGLSFVTEPQALRAVADPRTAAILGVPPREFIHVVTQDAIHENGALINATRILPHSSYDGMDRYPDPIGPRAPIIKALTTHHGPLTYCDRHGASQPTTSDRTSLKTPTLGALVNFAASVTRTRGGRGLMLDLLRYNAAETDITTVRDR